MAKGYTVTCPGCRRQCRITETQLGRKIVCVHCKQRFQAGKAETPSPTGQSSAKKKAA